MNKYYITFYNQILIDCFDKFGLEGFKKEFDKKYFRRNSVEITFDKVIKKDIGLYMEISVKNDNTFISNLLAIDCKALYHGIDSSGNIVTNDYLNRMKKNTKDTILDSDSVVNYQDFYLNLMSYLEQNLNDNFLTKCVGVTFPLNRNKIVIVNPIIKFKGCLLLKETITVTSKDAWFDNAFIIKIDMESNGHLEISEIYTDTKADKNILNLAIREFLNILDSFISPDKEILKESIKQALCQVNC